MSFGDAFSYSATDSKASHASADGPVRGACEDVSAFGTVRFQFDTSEFYSSEDDETDGEDAAALRARAIGGQLWGNETFPAGMTQPSVWELRTCWRHSSGNAPAAVAMPIHAVASAACTSLE